LGQAKAYVSWSDWAKQSLVENYGVDAAKVTVLAPGADLALFNPARREKSRPRILFVGGDFVRKGGEDLLRVFRQRLRGKAELHLVTGTDVGPEEDVFVYRGLTANSAPLLELFNTADIFALPTKADCLAMVLGEAMGASLPIITTAVGAHAEAVSNGINGFLIDGNEALGDALETLVDNPHRRKEMGDAGRQIAEERFDAAKNARAILALMEGIS
jgi:glycosyltransferase involved in cell wall biosynthesis